MPALHIMLCFALMYRCNNNKTMKNDIAFVDSYQNVHCTAIKLNAATAAADAICIQTRIKLTKKNIKHRSLTRGHFIKNGLCPILSILSKYQKRYKCLPAHHTLHTHSIFLSAE